MPEYDDEPMLIEALHDEDQAQPTRIRGGEMAEAGEAAETSEASGSISASVSGTASVGGGAYDIGTGFPTFTSVKAIRDKFNSEIDADEAEAEDRTAKVDEEAGDTPVLSQLAKAGAWVNEKETKVADGALRGAVDIGTGLVDLATAPPPDFEKMANDFDKPIDLDRAVGQDPNILIKGMKNTGVGRAIADGKYADAAGQAAMTVASFFVGGELGEASEMGVPDAVPDTVPDPVVPDTVPDPVVPDTVPDPVVPDAVPDAPAGPDPTVPDVPEAPPNTLRSPVGPQRAPVPDPDVPVVDPPAYEPEPLPPTVPTRLLPGGAPPTPDLVPDAPAVDPAPDVAPPASPTVDPPPQTLHSSFDPDYVPHPGEPVGYPPHGGAGGPWTSEPVNPMVDRYGSEWGRYLSPEGTPLEQRALAPRYDPDAAEQMGQPPDYDVGPNEYGVYKVRPGTTALQSPVAPAYGKPGGSTQYFTGTDPEVAGGPRVNQLNGDPILRPDGTCVQPRIGPDGREIPVPGVDRTGGPYSYQYGHSWTVEDIDPAERDALEAEERKP